MESEINNKPLFKVGELVMATDTTGEDEDAETYLAIGVITEVFNVLWKRTKEDSGYRYVIDWNDEPEYRDDAFAEYLVEGWYNFAKENMSDAT